MIRSSRHPRTVPRYSGLWLAYSPTYHATQSIGEVLRRRARAMFASVSHAAPAIDPARRARPAVGCRREAASAHRVRRRGSRTRRDFRRASRRARVASTLWWFPPTSPPMPPLVFVLLELNEETSPSSLPLPSPTDPLTRPAWRSGACERALADAVFRVDAGERCVAAKEPRDDVGDLVARRRERRGLDPSSSIAPGALHGRAPRRMRDVLEWTPPPHASPRLCIAAGPARAQLSARRDASMNTLTPRDTRRATPAPRRRSSRPGRACRRGEDRRRPGAAANAPSDRQAREGRPRRRARRPRRRALVPRPSPRVRAGRAELAASAERVLADDAEDARSTRRPVELDYDGARVAEAWTRSSAASQRHGFAVGDDPCRETTPHADANRAARAIIGSLASFAYAWPWPRASRSSRQSGAPVRWRI